MPSLFRFLVLLGICAAVVYGAMLALVTFVELKPRPIEQTVPASVLNKQS